MSAATRFSQRRTLFPGATIQETKEVSDGNGTVQRLLSRSRLSEQPPSRNAVRRPRQQTEEISSVLSRQRGIVCRRSQSLEWKSANEGEALIKAFQSKNGVIYAVLAYKAEAEIQGGSPTLVKRPLRK